MLTIRRIALIILNTFVAILLCSCGDETVNPGPPDGPAPSSVSWQSLNSIYASSANKRSYSMIYVFRSSCGYCQKMDYETFTDSAVVRVLWQYYNAAKLDTENSSVMVTIGDTTMSAQALAHTVYGVDAVPTMLILKKSGQYLTRVVGYRTPSQFKHDLENIAGIS